MRHHTDGFTLIELLIVVVIIGILAAIAIPKFGSTKGQAYVAAMKTDLRNLATAQEAYIYDNGVYYVGGSPYTALSLTPSAGVTLSISYGTAAGWGATATHTMTTRSCALFAGAGAAVAPATTEGVIACTTP